MYWYYSSSISLPRTTCSFCTTAVEILVERPNAEAPGVAHVCTTTSGGQKTLGSELA